MNYDKYLYLLTMVMGPSVETFIAKETRLSREDASIGIPSGSGISIGSTIDTACEKSCKYLYD